MRRRSFTAVVSLVLCCLALVPSSLEAQGSAKELISELKSGDSTRCMAAGNATADYQEHYQQFAAELAEPLIDILENGPCASSALTALVNVGEGIAEGISADRAIPVLAGVVEKGLAENAWPEATSMAGSAVFVIGHFGPAAAPAVPVLERWIFEREDSFDRAAGLGVLATIGDASAPVVPRLLPLLAKPAEDDERAWEKNETRIAVARTLGSIPAAASVSGPVLVEALSDSDYGFRYAASESIAMIGAPMVPYLVPALKSSDAEAKQTVLKILSGIGAGAAEAAPEIAPLLADEDWNVTYEAGEAMRQIGPTRDGIAALVKVLGEEKTEDAARAAAEILGGYGSAAKEALPALRKASGSRNWSISDAAKQAVSAIEAGE